MVPLARIEPGGSVAETFTDIVAPAAGRKCSVAWVQQTLFQARGFSQFAASPFTGLHSQEFGIMIPGFVREVRPDEVKKFMNQNKTQSFNIEQQIIFEYNLPPSNETARIHPYSPFRMPGK